jgi:hypothetical protein
MSKLYLLLNYYGVGWSIVEEIANRWYESSKIITYAFV